MTTTEHLNAIKAKCHELLTIAEKRTPGRWVASTESVWAKDEEDEKICGESGGWDVDFIASAAGPFEAALRSTTAAIGWLEMAHVSAYQPERDEAERVTREILAAWPIELLQNS